MISIIDNEGACRCGYAIKEVLGGITEHEIEKLTGTMTRGNKFVKSLRTKTGNDYWISRNPLYKLERATLETNRSNIASNERLKWTNRIQVAIGLLTMLFIAIQVYQGCDKEGKAIYRIEKTLPTPKDTVQRSQTNLASPSYKVDSVANKNKIAPDSPIQKPSVKKKG